MKTVILKRDGDADVEPNEALLASIASILEDDELDDAARNTMLIDTVSQYIVYTGADTANARRGAPLARTMFGPQSPDIVIAVVVKRAAAGERSDLSKRFFEGLGRIQAEHGRRPGETLEKARGRYWESDEGLLMQKAIAAAPLPLVSEPHAPTHGPAVTALHKRASMLCGMERGLTRAKAVAKIASSIDPADRAIWSAAKMEHTVA